MAVTAHTEGRPVDTSMRLWRYLGTSELFWMKRQAHHRTNALPSEAERLSEDTPPAT